jgi:hypothetical protein
MQETPQLLEAIEPQKGGALRRIVEQPYELSQADLTQPELRQAVKRAYLVLLEYRVRRLSQPRE